MVVVFSVCLYVLVLQRLEGKCTDSAVCSRRYSTTVDQNCHEKWFTSAYGQSKET